VWVQHDPAGMQVTVVTITMVGTGREFSTDDGGYAGSLLNGPFVWHFFAKAVTL
jgi:hypothetical protein